MSLALVGPLPPFLFSINKRKYIAFLRQLKEGFILVHGLRFQCTMVE